MGLATRGSNRVPGPCGIVQVPDRFRFQDPTLLNPGTGTYPEPVLYHRVRVPDRFRFQDPTLLNPGTGTYPEPVLYHRVRAGTGTGTDFYRFLILIPGTYPIFNTSYPDPILTGRFQPVPDIPGIRAHP
ncbi:hypothetical protein CRG98_016716 [Punica granatum]|uniref:Uncharacterized protein n=1 Tax=Punica granatum TaxID=22663 RepID=A0A2I0K2V9_PUNGR|nr:hypothetical protein CRG98_016716 [Punica granatum]